MRDIKTWEERIRPKIMEDFSLRIQKDLETIPPPNDLPEIESCFIYGKIHTGKTILAAWMYVEACRQQFMSITHETIEFVKISEFFNQIKRSYDDPELSEQTILDRYSETDILFFDDFGMERPTDWALSLLYLLVDRRYENLKTTIFTSNHSLGQIAEKFGDDRITSRIQRMCKVIHKTKF